jgi:hypothetical protein
MIFINTRGPMKALLSITVVLLLTLTPLAHAAKPKTRAPAPALSAEEILKLLKPQHPRLLLDRAGFDDLRKRVERDPVLREWDKHVRREADKLLAAPLAQHVIPDGKRLLATSRRTVDRTYTLALMYRLHGDRRHLDRLWREMEAVAAFPDFNPSHFLDTAEMAHALGIAYDWLYDAWTPQQRAVIRRAIVELGLKPGQAVYHGKGWWPSCDHNWNQVCNGGLTVGALAIADEDPALAGDILHRALGSLPLAMRSYAPDGAWGEGPGYWAYATDYNVLMLAGLRSALGTDFGLSEMKGFSEAGLFPLYMTGPTDRSFNFEDAKDHAPRSACLLWLAERFQQPVDAWFATERGKPTAAAMVWYRKPGQDPTAAKLPLDRYWRKVEVATFRGKWNDPKTVFVGIQAGSNRVNHNHLDLGSFVLDALGQRWAVDLGGDDYNLPGYFGGKRYEYYRLRAEGHNTLVLNPDQRPDQDVKADAKIARFVSNDKQAFAIADLTPAYARDAERVERGIAMLDRRSVLVQDEVLLKQPAELWWFMHTPAGVTTSDDGRTALLEQAEQRLQARILAPADARFEVRAAEPLPTSPKPERQTQNENIRKLAIHLNQVKDLRLVVLLTPVDGREDTAAPKVRPLAEW